MERKFKINDNFWKHYQNLVCESVIPYQRKVLGDEIPGVEKSHAIENFRIAAGLAEGDFYGWVFQDSDVAKWIEAAAYSLNLKPDPELEKDIDEIIDIIGKAQDEDGYLDTYFTIGNKEKRWQNLHEAHELYCSGHMMEAAVAYFEVTGKTALLEIMKRNADCIANIFGKDKKRGFPGHPEVELALVRLYKATGDKKYLELCQYFIDERGTEPNFFAEEAAARDWKVWGDSYTNRDYNQNYAPVREQSYASGHAVRAVYLYTGMAALAKETGDESLVKACNTLWDNITNKRMYINGGIGSTGFGEAFTADYDLPNDTNYAESCASIGLIFFAKKMLEINPNSKYSDVMERALYNCVLAGMSLDGKNFFYVNPMEVEPEYDGKLPTHKHVLPVRPSWYGCACCPPNIARLLASLETYAWNETETALYSDLFIGGEYEFCGGSILTETEYPYGNIINYTVKGDMKKALALRIPDWSCEYTLTVNGEECKAEIANGYAMIENLKDGDKVVLTLDFTPRKIYSNVLVRENQGGVAIQRGPLVYCIEAHDNPFDLRTVRIAKDSGIKVLPHEDILGGITPVELEGYEMTSSAALYSFNRPEPKAITLKAIPYYSWCNRGLNQMTVWLKEL